MTQQYPTPVPSGIATHRALVVTAERLYYGNGNSQATPPSIWENLGYLLNGAAYRIRGEGVVMLKGVLVPELTLYLTTVDHQIWRWGDARPWTTFRPQRGIQMPTVHVGLLDEIDADRTPLFDPRDEPGKIAAQLDLYHRLTGGPWHGTAGISGTGGIHNRYRREQPRWFDGQPMHLRGAGPLIWEAPDLAERAKGGYAIEFDVNAMYLNAARNAPLAWDALTHTGPQPFDPDAPGFWEISVPAGTPLHDVATGHGTCGGLPDCRPPLLTPRLMTRGACWVTTPVLKHLMLRGHSPDILDSWTCQRGAFILRTWAEHLAEARRQASGELLTAIKRTYTETVGMMAREGGRIYRRDWHHTIVDRARMSMLARLDTARNVLGISPVKVHIDAVTYLWPTADHTEIAEALGCSAGMGNFKHVKTVTVDEWHAERAAKARPAGRKPAGQRP